LNLNIHFNMLFLDDVYVEPLDGTLCFRWERAPTSAEFTRLAQILALRIDRCPETRGTAGAGCREQLSDRRLLRGRAYGTVAGFGDHLPHRGRAAKCSR
jgi:hypothetical protein